MHHRVGKLILAVCEEKTLQSIDTLQFLLIEQETGGIDRRPFDLVSPTPDGVKILQGNSPGIDFRVAGHTGRVTPMIRDPLFQRHLRNLRISQIDLGYGRGRWRRRIIQNAFEDPDSPLERVRIFPVRIHRQQTRLSQ